MATISTQAGGVIVVSIQPGTQTNGHQGPQEHHGRQICEGIPKFNAGRPLALGTVQIMIGLMMFLIGIPMAIDAESLGVISGIFAWGALIYIISGSLTVAAGRSTNRCLVNGAVAMNITAACISIPGIILYSLDGVGIMYYCNGESHWLCDMYMIRMRGISSILAIFNLLELFTSITVAGFGCNATCTCCCKTQPDIVIANASATGHPAAEVQSALPAHSPSQVVIQPKGPEEPINTGTTYPPPYN